MFEKAKLKFAIIALCCAFVGVAACGDDSSKGGGDSSNNQQQAGSSSFTVEVEAEGSTDTLSGSQKDEAAGEGSWGASIAGPMLHLTLASSDGSILSAVVITSEDERAPGTFALEDISLTSAMAGNVYAGTGAGTVTLSNCPRKMGDHVKGSFNNVVLKSEIGGDATQTISGNFDVVVYTKAGDLFCETETTPDNNTPGNNTPGNNTPGNNTPGNNGGTCRADECVEGGTCCPYMGCLANCNTECVMSEECMGGMNPAACSTCAMECLDSCGVSSECRSALVDLETCTDQYSCYETEDEDAEDQCVKDNCCSQLNAAF
ncbi:hypothetical protein [Bradymonas sediminis]|uniref:Uncharacterized protein n=1 Tax=Bradymonas sediminis TaxID=1548548 RepID=A0A2Z4FKN9_9DELT|nr:hypothetical protein [Bradymonas sediminis]AWV89365.1 hypothetical protein DN745_08460 [Bradymonas sediminis]TDP73545.1 hypothetical protein DFR33_106188 [Bradymonas sediminis]